MQNNYEMKARDSICRRRDEILDAIQNNNVESFRNLLRRVDNVHYQYDTHQYKSVLDIACHEGRPLILDALLQAHQDLDVNRMNEHHKKCPVHFAIESKDLDTVKLLLKHPGLDINIKSRSKGLISYVLKCLNDTREDVQNAMNVYEEIIRELLKAGADPSVQDNKGNTALHDAARQGQESIAKILLNHDPEELQLDGSPNALGKTARQAIIEAFPHLLDYLPSVTSPKPPNVELLWQDIHRHDEVSFLNHFRLLFAISANEKDRRALVNASNNKETLLQAAVAIGLHQVVSRLLDAGADPDLCDAGNPSSAALLACRNGDHKSLSLLMNSKHCSLRGPLLQEVVKEIGREPGRPDCDYRKCRDLLLRRNEIDINGVDVKGSTALHYAGRNRDDETVLKLLSAGAFIGSCNRLGDPSIADVSADTLEKYLDECIETNGHRPSEDTFTVTVHYDCLVPPARSKVCENRNDACSVPLVVEEEEHKEPVRFVEEMSAILYMSGHEELRRLLKHPVISSFLYLKWHRLRCIFRTNLALYSAFCMFLVLFILIGYGRDNEENPNVHTFSQCLWCLTILGLLLLMIREAFQVLISPFRYFRAFENYLELGLIGVTIAILFCNVTSEASRQQLSAIAILLSAAELMLLIGQMPTFSTNVVMLRTVSWNFLKFLVLNSVLIIAFALSFYTLFREDPNNDENNSNDTCKCKFNVTEAPKKEDNEEKEQNFFLHPAMALFKTIVMLTGEFDAGSINFGVYPITSHIIFVLFVFLIAIVLFNLLNGLAVSDTQAIKADAQLVGLVCRAQLLNYYENVLLGDINLYGQFVHKMKTLFCCVPQDPSERKCIRPFAKRICLFPCFLPRHQIDIKVNQGNRIEIPNGRQTSVDQGSKKNEQCCLNHCYHYKMDFRIVKSIKCILQRYETKSDSDIEIIKKLQTKVDAMECRFGQIEESISTMLGLLREIPQISH